ncbi:MAG: DNA polymerase III subunit delta' [Pseudomonadota bacterium]|nr:DNA polymerase III subunit delta' [Pseudomonadota bacterium]
MIVGHDRPVGQFLDAWATRRLHHAWLITGPRGVGKASFARAAAKRVLADAAGPASEAELAVGDDHPTAHLLSAGSHPDFRLLERVENKTGTALQRNISVDQVRSLADMLGVTPSMSPWRAIVIDSADDLEASAANALLKMLEEPPANTIFFIVAHAPGRLLPTIRSRCRRLEFELLADDVMTPLLNSLIPNGNSAGLIRLAGGSPGRAVQGAALDLAPLEAEARTIMAEGDPDNGRRSRLASSLSGKAAQDRYAAFLQLVPGLIASEARSAEEPRRSRALDAYSRARETAALAPRLSLDPGATMFELGGILASIAGPAASLKR